MTLVGALLAVQAQAAESPSIRFKVIDGRLCASCVISGEKASIPANVVIDLGSRSPLVVHQQTAKLLGLGHTGRVSLKFDDVAFPALVANAQGLRALEELTRDHATELNEIPVVAILGLGSLVQYTPQLEIAEQVLRLLPKGTTESLATEGMLVIPYEERNHSYWMAGTGPDGFRMRVRFSTEQHDTIIDAMVADLAGAPGGNLDQLFIGSLDVTRYVALRPEDLSSTPKPHPDVVLGTNLLASFRITIDVATERMFLEPIRRPRFPKEEQKFFIARAEQDTNALETFLTQHADSRLAPEAANLLLVQRLDEYPVDRDAVGRAMRLQTAVARPERRAQTMLLLADALLAGSRDDKFVLATDALEIGLVHAPEDLNARAGLDIHARMGMIALRRNDLTKARRHLLSAAFGMPRDPMVNLWLGELYERSGKMVRAWSRYVQAALSDDAPTEAFEGLDRLNHDRDFRASFTMADAQQLLEGRVTEFHPADRFEEGAPGSGGSPVRLVELFACVDHPDTLAAELAFGGLVEYLEQQDTALVAYHLGVPEPDPLVSDAGVSRADFYGVKTTPVVYFDGGDAVSAGGDEGDVKRTFAAYKQAACSGQEKATARRSATAWRLSGKAVLLGREIAGEVELIGPVGSTELRLHVLLCERVVMAPGGNGLVLHQNVVRSALSPAEGYTVPAAAGRRVFAISADSTAIGAALEQTINTMEQSKGIEFIMRPTYVDPALSVITVYLQDQRSKQVLAASEIEVTGRDER